MSDIKTSDEELRYTLRHTKVTAYAQGKAYNVNLATVIQKEDIDELMRIIKSYANSEITAVLDRLKMELGEDETLYHQSDLDRKLFGNASSDMKMELRNGMVKELCIERQASRNVWRYELNQVIEAERKRYE